MILLLINTAAEKPGVSLYNDGQRVGHKSWLAEMTVGSKLMEVVDGLLQGQKMMVQEVDRIAVHGGPGAHSSRLRVGATVGSILSLATGAELVSVGGEDEEQAVKLAMEKSAEAAIKIKYKGRGYSKG